MQYLKSVFRPAELRRSAVAILTTVILCQQLALAAGAAELRIERAGFPGAACADGPTTPPPPSFLAGSMQGIAVVVYYAPGSEEVPAYRGVTDWTWPEGLEIMVGLQKSTTDAFVASPELRARLHLRYYVSTEQKSHDLNWRRDGQLPLEARDRTPRFYFAFHIPDNVAGSNLCFQARFTNARYGELNVSKTRCLPVVAPCSEWDHDLLTFTRVMSASRTDPPEQTLALIDSVVATGWRFRVGLLAAVNIAAAAGRPGDALRYLDLCFKSHGTVRAEEGELASPEVERQGYLQARARLEELRGQQR